MITFRDGPAAGQTMDLQRAPYVLRVTFNGKAWDALNEADDIARSDESLHCYVMASEPVRFHICRSPRRLSGWHVNADYRLLTESPPDDATMRDNQAWFAWCDSNMERLLANCHFREIFGPKVKSRSDS